MLQTIIYSNVIIKKVSLNKVIFDLGRLPGKSASRLAERYLTTE